MFGVVYRPDARISAEYRAFLAGLEATAITDRRAPIESTRYSAGCAVSLAPSGAQDCLGVISAARLEIMLDMA